MGEQESWSHPQARESNFAESYNFINFREKEKVLNLLKKWMYAYGSVPHETAISNDINRYRPSAPWMRNNCDRKYGDYDCAPHTLHKPDKRAGNEGQIHARTSGEDGDDG